MDPLDTPLTAISLKAVMLADYANVREGLLNVVSAGLTRVAVASVPANVHIYVALQVYIPPSEIHRPHQGRVLFKYPDTAQMIGHAGIQLQVNAQPLPGEGVILPVIVSMQPIALPRFGQIDVQVELDGMPAGDQSFWLVQSAPKKS